MKISKKIRSRGNTIDFEPVCFGLYTKVIPEGWAVTAQPSGTTLLYTAFVLISMLGLAK